MSYAPRDELTETELARAREDQRVFQLMIDNYAHLLASRWLA
jgi:hypothetical protein